MYAELKTLMVEDLKRDGGKVTSEARLEEAGIDSVLLIELRLLVEEQFGVEFSDEELARLTAATVGELADLIATRRSQLQEAGS
jgi:acyl carrier protein